MKRFLPLLLMLLSSAVLAESGAYRVEVIVFRNLLATDEPAEIQELRSFSEFPDLAEDASTLEDAGALEETIPEKTTAIIRPGEANASPTPPLRDDLPDDLLVVTQKSTEMDTVWRRLRSSQNYRPLLYTAWDQNRVDYYPPIRIHNEQLIDTQLRPPSPVLVADLTKQDPLADYRSSFFQIDGSLQLRRSRFLHLYLDLEIREETTKDLIETGIAMNTELPVETLSPAGTPIAYGVHTLKQNRQISTGQMQYFDTPYFGALVFVSIISANQAP
jgi:hypothetical protein